MRLRPFATLLSVAILAACARETPKPAESPPAATAATGQKTWLEFVDGFIEARFAADPYFAVDSGRHEFDGKMPDWSRAALETRVTQLREQLAELDKYDSAALKPAQRFEREYVRWVIEKDLFWQAGLSEPFRNPTWYLEKLDPSMYLTREYAPLPKRLQGLLGYARAVPKLTAEIRANVRTPIPRAFIERSAAGFAGYASFYRDELPAVYRDLADQQLKSELDAAVGDAARSMDELTRWLESQRATATGDFALGAAKFSQMLRETERVDIPLEELEEVGRKDLERNRAALKEACASYAPKATLAGCVERMRADKPTGGTLEGARLQLADLRKFVVDRKIVTIPNQEQALVAESPPYNRGNFAYISIPGPYENPAVKATYYVAPPDARWSAAERNAYLPGKAYLLFVSAHEVWPGHYLQSQFANGNPSRVAALWWDYAFGEGWAHYTEEMMYDAGLGDGKPEARIGMLANALLRDVRFISAICLHTGCMSLDESEKMFREQAFADAGNARQQALRGTYDPGYLAYTLGKLMIRKLRTDWLAANPDASPQQFHDRFLSFGVPPIPLVREQMVGKSGSVL